jgi:CheY-like chemotaxis protein
MSIAGRAREIMGRVLLVEDSDVLRRVVQLCLDAIGVELEARDDGEAGLEAALGGGYDLVILDVGLPVMSGWQVLERLRADPETRDVPIMVLSADTNHESRSRAAVLGATAFLGKPFRTSELRATVVRLMREPAHR